MSTRLKEVDLERYFPRNRGWAIIERPLSDFDNRETVLGKPLRCIDKDFGNTPQGYKADTVPLAPAWPGAIDGVVPYMSGTPTGQVEEASRRTESVGFKAAHHGDYLTGRMGCRFRNALMAGRFENLLPITNEEYQILTTKSGVHYTELIRPSEYTEPDGFVLNDNDFTIVLPNGGMYYPVETWFGRMVGIPYEVALSMIEKTGELLLPESSRRLFIATKQ